MWNINILSENLLLIFARPSGRAAEERYQIIIRMTRFGQGNDEKAKKRCHK